MRPITRRSVRGMAALVAVACALAALASGCARVNPNPPAVPAQAPASRPGELVEGDPARRAIFDALRPVVAADLGRMSVVKADSVVVIGSFALVRGVPTEAMGAPFDYSTSTYATAVAAGEFRDGIVALLQNIDGRWAVVEYAIGAVDDPAPGWIASHGAPQELLP